MPGPYGEAALIYYQRGWGDVFPVGSAAHPLAKSPVPVGVTGYSAKPIGWERIKAATLGRHASYNLGIRMPRSVICLDVDEYQDHAGAATLASAEAALGPLPPTYRSTARGCGDSGHRFYRTPLNRITLPGAEEVLAKRFGPNIEILHWGRRYALAWPSRNPDAGYATYCWYGPDGELLDGPPPRVVDLPELPAAWAELLTTPITSETATPTGGGGNLRAAKPGEDEDEDFMAAPMLIRASVAASRSLEQVRAVRAMTAGSVNKTLGGAGIWLARMAASGLWSLEDARSLVVTAATKNGVHSDSWNAANKRRWTLASRVDDALSQGLNRQPYTVINDIPAGADVLAQLQKEAGR